MDENFAFYGKTLTGAAEQTPRWKRCVQATDSDLGEALGKAYVDRTFGAEGKARTLEMVKAIEASMGRDIDAIDWMSPETKKAAVAKLTAVANKIGYPDRWRDYSSLRIVRGDAYGNSQRANTFAYRLADGEDRQARRQDRVADDAADGQRVLQPAREQHQLPGRHPAAAVLHQGRRRRGQLRRRRARSSATS